MMKTETVKACLLNNGDTILDVDGLIRISDFKIITDEKIVLFTATKENSNVSQRWGSFSSLYNRVITE